MLISYLADAIIRSDLRRQGRETKTSTQQSRLFSPLCWILPCHTPPPQWLCWVPLTTGTQVDVVKPVYGALAKMLQSEQTVIAHSSLPSVFHHGWFNLCVLIDECTAVMHIHSTTHLISLTKTRRGQPVNPTPSPR